MADDRENLIELTRKMTKDAVRLREESIKEALNDPRIQERIKIEFNADVARNRKYNTRNFDKNVSSFIKDAPEIRNKVIDRIKKDPSFEKIAKEKFRKKINISETKYGSRKVTLKGSSVATKVLSAMAKDPLLTATIVLGVTSLVRGVVTYIKTKKAREEMKDFNNAVNLTVITGAMAYQGGKFLISKDKKISAGKTSKSDSKIISGVAKKKAIAKKAIPANMLSGAKASAASKAGKGRWVTSNGRKFFIKEGKAV